MTELHCGAAVIKDGDSHKEAMEVLAAYESTGLTPAEVQGLKERDTKKKMVKGEVYSQVCPVCKHPVTWRFCPNCGQRLREN